VPKEFYYKNDIWLFGMILLEVTTLRDNQDLYLNKNIRQDFLQLRLAEIASIYSSSLCNLISAMLTLNP
jgi:hypothetical protein